MKRSSASTLPHDVIVEILLRLPARSILRFRAASQQWRASTMHPSFLCDQARRSPPAVVFQRPGSSRIYLFNGEHVPIARSIDDDASLPPLTLEASCDDSLLFSAPGGRDYYAYNLITRQWTSAPETASGTGFLVGFYPHPASGEHRVLRSVVKQTEREIKLHGFEVAAMGASTWRGIKKAPLHEDLLWSESPLRSRPVAVHGRLHWNYAPSSGIYFGNEIEKSFVVFDINTEEFSLMAVPGSLNYKTRNYLENYRHNYLFEMNGELMLWQATSMRNMLMWVRKGSSWEVRAAVSTTSLGKKLALYHLGEMFPLGFCSKDELLLRHWGRGRPFIFDFKSDTLKLVESFLDIEPWYAPTRESIAFYDAFERADWLNGKGFVVF